MQINRKKNAHLPVSCMVPVRKCLRNRRHEIRSPILWVHPLPHRPLPRETTIWYGPSNVQRRCVWGGGGKSTAHCAPKFIALNKNVRVKKSRSHIHTIKKIPMCVSFLPDTSTAVYCTSTTATIIPPPSPPLLHCCSCSAVRAHQPGKPNNLCPFYII